MRSRWLKKMLLLLWAAFCWGAVICPFSSQPQTGGHQPRTQISDCHAVPLLPLHPSPPHLLADCHKKNHFYVSFTIWWGGLHSCCCSLGNHPIYSLWDPLSTIPSMTVWWPLRGGRAILHSPWRLHQCLGPYPTPLAPWLSRACPLPRASPFFWVLFWVGKDWLRGQQ